jgi:hypothetical protein
MTDHKDLRGRDVEQLDRLAQAQDWIEPERDAHV